MAIGAKGRVWVVCILIVFVAAFFVSSWQVNEEARIAPLFISSISLITLLFLLRAELKNARRADSAAEASDQEETEQPMGKETYRKLGVITLWLLVTALLLIWFDYMAVFVIMQFILTYFISQRPLVQSIASTFILGAFVYVLFRVVLGVG